MKGPFGHRRSAKNIVVCILRGGGDFSIHFHSADEEGFSFLTEPPMAQGKNNRRLVR